MKRTCADSGRRIAGKIIAAGGLGSYWAWMNLSTANASLFPWLAETLYPPQLLLSSGAYLIAMVALFVAGESCWVRRHRTLLMALGSICAIGGAISTAVGALCAVSPLLLLGAVTSLGTSVLLVYWGALFSSCDSRSTALMTTGSFAFGTFAYLVLSEFAGPLLIYLLPVLLVFYASALLYLTCLDGAFQEGLAQAQVADRSSGVVASRRIVLILIGLGVCVVLNEVLRLISTPLAPESFTKVGRLTQFGGLLISVAAFLSVLGSRKPFSFNTMALVLVPLMVAGFLSFLVFAGSGSLSMFILLGAGYWCLNMLVWVTLCGTVRRTHSSPIRSFALFYGIIQVAILTAKPLGDWVSQHLSVTPSGLSLIVSVSVLVIVIGALLLLHDREVTTLLGTKEEGRPEGASPGKSGSQARRNPDWLTSMAARYGLTPRETEVFLLLARGRSLPIIREELSIATGTAQTHIRHIYEKMGVHARQELFDLIEQEESEHCSSRDRGN